MNLISLILLGLFLSGFSLGFVSDGWDWMLEISIIKTIQNRTERDEHKTRLMEKQFYRTLSNMWRCN